MMRRGTSGTRQYEGGAFRETSGQLSDGSLDQIDAVNRLDDLNVPPGNRLHALEGSLRGFHAVRVNDQYRILFRFEGVDAFDVRCTDYH